MLSRNVTEKSPDYGGRACCFDIHISVAAAGVLKF